MNWNVPSGRCGGLLLLVVLLAASWTAVGAQERMPLIPADKMTEAQRKAVADFRELREQNLAGPPWSVLLRVPDLLIPAVQVRLHLQFRSVLDQRLTEFAILMAAREWTNSFEWNGHYNAGVKAGLEPEIIAAVADGRRPAKMADDETVVYDFCTELIHNRSISDATYARALAAFGEAGIVEMAHIQGYYATLAMVMNAARVSPPPTATQRLERFPR